MSSVEDIKYQIKYHRDKIEVLKKLLPVSTNDIAKVPSAKDPDFIELYPLLSQDFASRPIEIIAQLVKGKSNSEIGDALFIGEKTVKYHVTRILNKLGCSRRGQIIAIMSELRKPE